jgi:Cellulase (glycosyl hydrolase family 5)
MHWMGRTIATGAWLVALAGGASPIGWGAASSPTAAPVARPDSGRVAANVVVASRQREKNPGTPEARVPERPEVHRIQGWLHTVGTDIVDARGRVVRFAGIDVSGMGHGWGSAIPRDGRNGCPGWEPPTPAEYANVRHWGFNVVRLSFSWANLEPTAPRGNDHTYNLAYVRAIQREVTGFTSRGVAVVLEMAQSNWSPAFAVRGANHLKCGVGMPLWLYGASPGSLGGSSGGPTIGEAKRAFFANRGNVQAGYAAAWRFLVRRFAHNHLVVGADMMNEPFALGAFPTSRLHLARLYARVGRAIRGADPHLLLIFQDSRFLGPRSLVLRGPPSLPNVVYTFHLYRSSWGEARPMVRTYLRRARAWGVPLWISEFDAFHYASPHSAGPAWRSNLRAMLAFCRRGGIGWSEFSYADRWMLQPGTQLAKPGLIPALRAGM